LIAIKNINYNLLKYNKTELEFLAF